MFSLIALVLMAAPVSLPTTPLPSSRGGAVSLSAEVPVRDFTVLVFFSPDCPVMRAHDEVLKSLAATVPAARVAFYLVHSQAESSAQADGRAAKEREYPFALLSDPDGLVADALNVRFSTTVVVLDGKGRVRYRGGIDSNAAHTKPQMTPHLSLALTALLEGREPPKTETKSLGCVLRRQ